MCSCLNIVEKERLAYLQCRKQDSDEHRLSFIYVMNRFVLELSSASPCSSVEEQLNRFHFSSDPSMILCQLTNKYITTPAS